MSISKELCTSRCGDHLSYVKRLQNMKDTQDNLINIYSLSDMSPSGNVYLILDIHK